MTSSDRPIPIRSIDYQDPASREAAHDRIFLDELYRQAEIANRNIAQAWGRASNTQDVHDPQTWSLLQGALFAAIIVTRILKPRDVRSYPPLTAKESRELAELRGSRLRTLLEIDEDSDLFSVDVVRNSFEHFDERLDARLVAGAQTIADWYITDGTALMTPEQPHGPGGVGLRVFFPAGGILYFDRDELDLFRVDIALLDLRRQVESARQRLKAQIKGRGRFTIQAVHLMTSDEAHSRSQEWLRMRTEAGELP
jgi:hypothetical protein